MEEDSSRFGSEMRRRVRWQLWYLNRRIRDGQGQGPNPFDQSSTPGVSVKPPLNCHDSDLCTDMAAPPSSHSGWTAMSFCLLRYDLATAEQIVESDSPWLLKTKAVQECQQKIQHRYLTYCDGAKPIHWLASHIAYVMITEMRMKLYSPQFAHIDSPVSLGFAIRDQLFDAAVDILDTRKRLEDETAARQWEWTLSGYLQYVPLTFLLNELCWRQSDPRVEAAWEVAEKAFQRWSENAKKSKPGTMLNELMSNAQIARREAAELQYMADSYLLQDQSVFDEFLVDSVVNADTMPLDGFQLGLPTEWASNSHI
ncbi:fungal specific transcription factor domain-containing protein [Aspergillus stella-maris]|uniref:fungal specific transcription factor domain-containing protein n=1 Tax=Aspergillus stella-maris TaxID=1810926 RepID=UPI003CCD507F